MIQQITASGHIDAPAPAIYAIIADYHDGHRRIVPPRVFQWLAVDRGGIGAGTEIRFAMRVFGSVRVSRGEVTEPQPGRVLVETYPDTGDVTTFIVVPSSGDGASEVTITTDLHLPDGLLGRIQALMAKRFLVKLYHEELQRLADVAQGRVLHDPVPQHPPA